MAHKVSTKELMESFGVSRQTITNYVDQGMPKLRAGSFDLDSCWRWRYERLQSDIEDRIANLDKDEQDARLKRVSADLKERELAELDGKLVDIDKVTLWLSRMIGSARAAMLVLPTKLAPQVIACRSVNDAKTMLEREVHQTLDELSRSAVKVSDLAAVSQGDEGGSAGVGPASQAQSQSVGRRKGVPESRGLGRAGKVPRRQGRVPTRHDGRRHRSAE